MRQKLKLVLCALAAASMALPIAAQQVPASGKSGAFMETVIIPRKSFPLFGKFSNGGPPAMNQTVDSFSIGKYEVTQAQFESVMGYNNSRFVNPIKPKDQASWYEAIVFCNLLSIKEGLDPAYSIDNSTNPKDWGKIPKEKGTGQWDKVVCEWEKNGYRLPTDMEWRSAAMGNYSGPSFGESGNMYKFAGDPNPGTPGGSAEAFAWFKANSLDLGESNANYGTHPVGQKKPNDYGLFDMAGNVWEWVWDWVTGRGYQLGDNVNYRGPESGNGLKIRMGGSWFSEPYFAANGGHEPWLQEGDAGFRVARTKLEALKPDTRKVSVPVPTKGMQSAIIGQLRFIPAGSFQRTANPADISRISQGFFMGTTDVTHAQFQSLTGFASRRNTEYSTGDNDPISRVSWYHAIYFCNKLSIKEGRRPVYTINGSTDPDDWKEPPNMQNTPSPLYDSVTADFSANGYRLPTEMEWMWAALGARDYLEGLKQCSGYGLGGTATKYAWYSENVNKKTMPVGMRDANELGLYDMSGNVRQWMWDGFAPWPLGELVDYSGPSAAAGAKVLKGGCWWGGFDDITVGSRDGRFFPGNWDVDTGFRVVCR